MSDAQGGKAATKSGHDLERSSRRALDRSRTVRGWAPAADLRHAMVTAVLGALMFASPAVARAQTTDQTAAADAAFQEGTRLMAEGKIKEACPKLAASHHLDPSYGAVYNLGRCYEALGKTASAWAAF